MVNQAAADQLAQAIEGSEAIVIGAGAGLSASAGFDYSGERFTQWCKSWEDAYDVHDFYRAGFYPFPTREEFWGYWSASIMANRYECGVGEAYSQLKGILEGKDYFVLTTNVDHQFQLAGFGKERLFYTQGDYGLFQCSEPCCEATFDNEEMVRAMYAATVGTAIPSDMIPRCPHCGQEMSLNLRADDTFVEDEGWRSAARHYRDFLNRTAGKNVLFLELGVGFNTPGIIKYPFWGMVGKNKRAVFAAINQGEAYAPSEIEERSIVIDGDIAEVISGVSGILSRGARSRGAPLSKARPGVQGRMPI